MALLGGKMGKWVLSKFLIATMVASVWYTSSIYASTAMASWHVHGESAHGWLDLSIRLMGP